MHETHPLCNTTKTIPIYYKMYGISITVLSAWSPHYKTLKYKKLKKPTPQCHLGPMNITEVNWACTGQEIKWEVQMSKE